jgi:hypothetical protein
MKPISITGQIHSNQTGRFPITSSRGSKYIMVIYDYDSNAILTEPLTSCTETELLRAYSKLHNYLTAHGLKPVLQRLDNEAPAACNLTCAQIPLPSSSLPLTTIDVTPRKKPSALGKITLSLASAALIQTFPCTSGLDSFHKPPLPSTCFANPTSTLDSWLKPNSTAFLTSTPLP